MRGPDDAWMNWAYIQAPGTFNKEAFETIDELLALANRYGVRVIFPFTAEAGMILGGNDSGEAYHKRDMLWALREYAFRMTGKPEDPVTVADSPQWLPVGNLPLFPGAGRRARPVMISNGRSRGRARGAESPRMFPTQRSLTDRFGTTCRQRWEWMGIVGLRRGTRSGRRIARRWASFGFGRKFWWMISAILKNAPSTLLG